MTYDPLADTIVRLGFPEGDAFLAEHSEAIGEAYGEDIAGSLLSAVRSNDVDAADRFACLLNEDFQYRVLTSGPEALELAYSAGDEIKGTFKLNRNSARFQGEGALDPLVVAVLSASESVFRRVGMRPSGSPTP